MDKTDLIFLVPLRYSKYDVVYSIFEDIFKALSNYEVSFKFYALKDIDNKDFVLPNFPIEIRSAEDITDVLNNNQKFFTVDDYRIVRFLSKNRIRNNNAMIWSLYFYGHKFLFKEYNSKIIKKEFKDRVINVAQLTIPRGIQNLKTDWFIKTLKEYRLTSLSIWNALLLNRVYELRCEDILYPPIDLNYFQHFNKKEDIVIVFIGNNYDTDLVSLKGCINVIRETMPELEFQFFGNREIGINFATNNNIEMKYLGKPNRSELANLLSKAVFSINPIYNGNLEMFPLESLLAGTPIISFIQPFLEIIGITNNFCNIIDYKKIKNSIKSWKSEKNEESIKRDQLRIRDVLDSNKFVNNLCKIL